MKAIKILGLILAALVMYTASPAYADYSIVLKNESGVVLKTYPVTAAQVQHLQKAAALTGKSVINQVKEAILDLIAEAEWRNREKWQADNDAFIEEQSRL